MNMPINYVMISLPMCDMRMIYFLDIYHKCVDSNRSSELKEKLLTIGLFKDVVI